MTKKVLLIGNGAREHAIAKAIMRSPQKVELYSFMKAKNPGIAAISKEYVVAKSLSDLEALTTFVNRVRPSFAVIGPEDPLEKGVVDFLETLGVKSVGPKKVLAQLETSKGFTRTICSKYRIPGNPEHMIFGGMEGVEDYLQQRSDLSGFVIKPDGLTGGKGVMVQGDHLKTVKEGVEYCKKVLDEHTQVIIEERLEGEEFSLQCLTDGTTVVATPPVQDHKRAFDDDKGPNTGGMGSYSCEDHLLPFLRKEHVDQALEITRQVCSALKKETGVPYKGVMYGGFIVTAYGVKLIEYNARFGDPEAMNVLPIMASDFVSVCEAIIHGTLDKMKVVFDHKATVCKYAVPKGYPDNPVSNEKITILDLSTDAELFYAAVDERNGEIYLSKSRSVAFVGKASTIEKAEQRAEKAISSVQGPVFHRKDIGTKALIDKRVKHMHDLGAL